MTSPPPSRSPGPIALAAGELEAVFLPAQGMLGASFRHRGVELLRRVGDLEAAAAKGSTAGIPLLHPWANRLEQRPFRVAGREVHLDAASPLLHFDAHGLPIHGVPWSRLAWEVTASSHDHLAARLDWRRKELLAVFPFPHRVELLATLRANGLTLETTVVAGPDGSVPVSFGFHPYLGLPDLPASRWRLTMPQMNRLLLDRRGIPTGAEAPWDRFDGARGQRSFDHGFALPEERASFSLTGSLRRISVDFLEGYRHAQIFAPKDQDFVAIEPMTAPTNALVSGRGLTVLAPRARFRAAFRIRVEGGG